jgi:hypothetical protein
MHVNGVIRLVLLRHLSEPIILIFVGIHRDCCWLPRIGVRIRKNVVINTAIRFPTFPAPRKGWISGTPSSVPGR